MSYCRLSWLLLVLIVGGGLGLPASAGVRRHDRNDSDYLNLADDYPSVGQLRGTKLYHLSSGDELASFAASGTLIAPSWVLTAAHAISDDPAGITKGVPFEVTSLEFILGGTSYSPVAWIPYGGFDWNPLSGTDIGLLRFSEDLATAAGVTPAKRYTGTEEVGKKGISAGYGATGTGLTGADLSVDIDDLVKRAGENAIDALLGNVLLGASNNVLLSDFDNPGAAGDSFLGSVTPEELEYLIAPGDSGGGLFVEIAGESLLVGIHSFGFAPPVASPDYPPPYGDGSIDYDYGDGSGHTRVSAFNDWINATIPEPASIVVWSLVVGLCMTVGRRRRSGA